MGLWVTISACFTRWLVYFGPETRVRVSMQFEIAFRDEYTPNKWNFWHTHTPACHVGKARPAPTVFFLPFLPSVRSVLRPFYFAHNIHTKSGKGLQWAPAGGGGGWSAGKGWHLDTNIPHRIPNQVYAFRAGVSLAMACYTTCYTRLTPSGPRVLAYINWHCFFFFLEREFECELKCINITGSHCSNRSI